MISIKLRQIFATVLICSMLACIYFGLSVLVSILFQVYTLVIAETPAGGCVIKSSNRIDNLNNKTILRLGLSGVKPSSVQVTD